MNNQGHQELNGGKHRIWAASGGPEIETQIDPGINNRLHLQPNPSGASIIKQYYSILLRAMN